jgi:carboxypeptidase PM20D1
MRKWLAALGLVVVALAVAVGAKTLATPSRQLAVAAAKPVAVDAAAASARLGAAVRFKTIASDRDVDANAAEFLALHAHLQASFPKLHAALTREVIGKYGLLYTWAGSDAQAAPIAFLAHQDVVPIAPGTDGDWQVPPFSGVEKDGFVWGRGAWDDKGNLMAMLEAVEMRVAAGFTPRQTIYLAFGADEELGGTRGAQQIARLLKERGVRLRWAIDEGMLVTEDAIPGLAKPAALIGIAEKGRADARADRDRDARPFVDATGRRGSIGDRHAERSACPARGAADAVRARRRRSRDLRHRRSGDGGE